MSKSQRNIKLKLADMLAGLLNIEKEDLDENTDLREFGLDSVALNEFAEMINSNLGTEIDSTLLFEYSTIKEIGEYLLSSGFVKEDSQEESDFEPEPQPESKSEFEFETGRELEDLFPELTELEMVKEPDFAEKEEEPSDDIAIIGISGRMPQSDNLEEFWEHLVNCDDLITEIPKDRWDWERDKSNSHSGGFLKDIRRFDAEFFHISPREAAMMDPQQRILLEEVWCVLEDAGYQPSSVSGTKTGVFIGAGNDDYNQLIAKSGIEIDSYAATGTYFSILSNRISYLFHLLGPSITMDTACSSSLVAIHQAVTAIKQNECEMAIAGGVNLICDPRPYLSFSHAGMLSKDSKCKTFDKDANGYVRAEGAGVLLLKPLKKAIQEGRHIYGIIKGSAVNHNGKTNSLTAPSPVSQAEVIMSALKRGKINPNTISYIEAHGTGTSLGDPIEINGLKKAFFEYSEEQSVELSKEYCGLGSVKTNTGHLEFASGMAGIFKVLLSMKHKTIPGNLNLQETNPMIHLEDSPFYIVDSNREWIPLKDESGNAIPRRAGISSFGFGGANAHVIIEEYEEPICRREEDNTNTMIVVSAKNENRLKVHVKNILDFIRKHHVNDSQLTDLAYTLQTGREAMSERLAVLTDSVNDLAGKLEKYLDGQADSDIFCGNIRPYKDMISIFQDDEVFDHTILKWGEQEKFDKILSLWVKGMPISWNVFYQSEVPKKMSLPTYPFLEEHHWLPSADKKNGVQRAVPDLAIHPLLHKNISSIHKQKYQTFLSGDEFFLKAHVIQGKKLLPGVAYLEMALAAARSAMGEDDNTKIMLRDVVWTRAIQADTSETTVEISLSPMDNGNLDYEVCQEDGVCNKGRISVREALSNACQKDIRQMLKQSGIEEYSKEECYQAYRKFGFAYGIEHQGIEKIYRHGEEVIAKLDIPQPILSTGSEYTLHPSLLDSAIQATIGFTINDLNESSACIPFALQELLLFDKKPEISWAIVHMVEPETVKKGIRKFDIDLCDREGTVTVQMKGLVLKCLDSTPSPILFVPEWKEKKADTREERNFDQYIGVFCNIPENVREEISNHLDKAFQTTSYYVFDCTEKELVGTYEEDAILLIQELKRILLDHKTGNNLLQMFVPDSGVGKIYAGFSGFMKTIELENPRLVGQIIHVDIIEPVIRTMEKILLNSKNTKDKEVQYIGGARYVKTWREINESAEKRIPWKNKGVYLITGGSGKLGLLFAEELAKKAVEPVILLIGRRPLNQEIEKKLHLLKDLGAEVMYKQMDIVDSNAVKGLVENTIASYGKINGILHCAGVIHDNLLLNKTMMEIRSVLEPKMIGLKNLDVATEKIPLDFFALFSSIAGALGNIGQTDYSAANAFMDQYAGYRNELVRNKKRSGITFSINWPLWKDGGMHMSDAAQKAFYEKTGIDSLQTAVGMEAFYQICELMVDEAMVLTGNKRKITQFLLGEEDQPKQAKENLIVTDIMDGEISEEAFLSLFLEEGENET